jgi:PPK2 family polyphosphate:nucleotide phosphotransferase
MKMYRVKPGSKFSFKDHDPEGPGDIGTKEAGLLRLAQLRSDIQDLQRVLYAEHTKRLLVILQAMDTGGKDGTVRQVFSGIDPHGFRVVPFKAPTAAELEHDFLWRIHAQAPAQGEIVVFNRSHYEDIVAVNVKNLMPKAIWEKRYEHIINFERMLADEGTTIIKLFLNISFDEQRRRLQERLQNPRKHWKFDPEDIRDRDRWPSFISAYTDVIGRTSTEQAPWYIVPANKKWYRNIVVAETIKEALIKLEPSWPQNKHDLSTVVLK